MLETFWPYFVSVRAISSDRYSAPALTNRPDPTIRYDPLLQVHRPLTERPAVRQRPEYGLSGFPLDVRQARPTAALGDHLASHGIRQADGQAAGPIDGLQGAGDHPAPMLHEGGPQPIVQPGGEVDPPQRPFGQRITQLLGIGGGASSRLVTIRASSNASPASRPSRS